MAPRYNYSEVSAIRKKRNRDLKDLKVVSVGTDKDGMSGWILISLGGTRLEYRINGNPQWLVEQIQQYLTFGQPAWALKLLNQYKTKGTKIKVDYLDNI